MLLVSGRADIQTQMVLITEPGLPPSTAGAGRGYAYDIVGFILCLCFTPSCRKVYNTCYAAQHPSEEAPVAY